MSPSPAPSPPSTPSRAAAIASAHCVPRSSHSPASPVPAARLSYADAVAGSARKAVDHAAPSRGAGSPRKKYQRQVVGTPARRRVPLPSFAPAILPASARAILPQTRVLVPPTDPVEAPGDYRRRRRIHRIQVPRRGRPGRDLRRRHTTIRRAANHCSANGRLQNGH